MFRFVHFLQILQSWASFLHMLTSRLQWLLYIQRAGHGVRAHQVLGVPMGQLEESTGEVATEASGCAS